MTVAEAAEALGVSERTVWRYLRSGRLHGETVGPVGQQRTLIDPDGIEAVRAGRGGEQRGVAEAGRGPSGERRQRSGDAGLDPSGEQR